MNTEIYFSIQYICIKRRKFPFFCLLISPIYLAKIYLSTCLLGNILTCQRLTTAIVFLQLIPDFPTIFFATHLECVTNSFNCLSKSESALSSSGPTIAAPLIVHIEQCPSGSARLSAMFLPTCESSAMSVPL